MLDTTGVGGRAHNLCQSWPVMAAGFEQGAPGKEPGRGRCEKGRKLSVTMTQRSGRSMVARGGQILSGRSITMVEVEVLGIVYGQPQA